MSPVLYAALRRACDEVGIAYRQVPADGRWHETDVLDDPRGLGDARTRLFADGDGGHVWNWKGAEKVFFVSGGRECERAAHERKRQESVQQRMEEEARRNAEAASKAAAIWKDAVPARSDHPYLLRKGVAPVPTLRELPLGRLSAFLGYTPKSKGEPLQGRILVVPVKVAGLPFPATLELIDEAGNKSALVYWVINI